MARIQRGLTLVELLVTLAIMAILLPIGFSGLSAAATSMRLTSASNLLLSRRHYARSEAIKRNSRVVLCKSRDGVAVPRNAAVGSKAGSSFTTPITTDAGRGRDADPTRQAPAG